MAVPGRGIVSDQQHTSWFECDVSYAPTSGLMYMNAWFLAMVLFEAAEALGL